MDRPVTPTKRVSSPTWGPPPPYKQALNGSMNEDYTYYRKLTLHEIKVLEINVNLMKNDFQIKEIDAKEVVTVEN